MSRKVNKKRGSKTAIKKTGRKVTKKKTRKKVAKKKVVRRVVKKKARKKNPSKKKVTALRNDISRTYYIVGEPSKTGNHLVSFYNGIGLSKTLSDAVLIKHKSQAKHIARLLADTLSVRTAVDTWIIGKKK